MRIAAACRCLLFTAACLFFASGCTKELTMRGTPGGTFGEAELAKIANAPPAWEQADAGAGLAAFATDGTQAKERTPTARQMIYSARFQLSTANVEDALGQLVSTVSQLGGYLESRENARVVCRVPATQFATLVDQIPSWGLIVHQSIKTEDVTRQHRDLRIRLEAADTSRRRVLALMERAEKIEDIIKLEDELRKLTEMVEQLQSAHATLGEQIAYSRVEVFFQPHAEVAKSGGTSARSPFPWLNRIGVERVLGDFGSVTADEQSIVESTAALLPGAIKFQPPTGFLLVQHDRNEVRAITSDESKLWIRRFTAPREATLDFWSDALRRHLSAQRGYKLIAEGRIAGADRNEGMQFEFETVAGGQSQRYLLRLHVEPATFPWSSTSIRVMEFVATKAAYAKHAVALGVVQPLPTSSSR